MPSGRRPHQKMEVSCPSSKELLEILACPKCKGDLRLDEKEDGLICDKCRLLYEIKDDIPIMLIEEAKPLKMQFSVFSFRFPVKGKVKDKGHSAEAENSNQ